MTLHPAGNVAAVRVIPGRAGALYSSKTCHLEFAMKIWTKLLVPVALMVLSGCVVVPRGYYARGARVAVVAAVPIVVVRPAYYGRYRW